MHVCENNCALTVEDEIQFWGLDETLLQVFTHQDVFTSYLTLNIHSFILSFECFSNSMHIIYLQPCCMIKYYPQVVTAREDKKIEVSLHKNTIKIMRMMVSKTTCKDRYKNRHNDTFENRDDSQEDERNIQRQIQRQKQDRCMDRHNKELGE